MEVVFLRSFLQDIKKINDKKLKGKLQELITNIENSDSLESIENIRKMKGHTSAYRWRFGNYRVGFYKSENKIELARLAKRNDIYKLFP
ncbi:mRNA-degrading endonuclease RelE, toxin component of the RelBE toxin-antitoxin system [Cruoricaptor ignavus]|uniref:mRNA-degrading endonuclease RelE, toxin component of the RelBE toxin-antitoxin system n=1 Tax=Cruoricaptor ignavus TaxID=1118202 RepID=A0A1M6DUX0_9FLAO|nr:mRNA-degrading endonuclease RelE, toxin component of the RelBE toxin-antitoxin system [Cruoricaptor ignavus]